MSKQDLFIGRTDELKHIHNWLDDWNVPQIVWINGDGGIGKTRLLKETYNRFAARDTDSRLLFPPIFDFDNRTLQVLENLEFEIARQLGKDAAKLYLRLLSDLRKMETGDVSLATIENQKKNLYSEFLASINRIAKDRRIVLLFDTTDAFDDSQKWGQVVDLLEDMLQNIANIFVAVAGRKSLEHQQSVGPNSVLYGHLIDLTAFDLAERRQYIQQKQLELHIELEPEMKNKVLALSQGKPILIDLATHWLAREYPVEWLEESALDQKEFEKKLVLQIAQVRSQTDRLILLLSRAYPLDVKAISELLKLPIDEAAILFEEASSYVFIKVLPQGQITLHDEMRRMVLEFVWDKFDPNRERRKRDSRLFVSYLDKKIETVTEHIQQLKSKGEAIDRPDDASSELKFFVERESLEHELWDMKEQRLYHLMYLLDYQRGIDIFVDLFDEATASYNFQLREDLLDITAEHIGKLSPKQKNEVESRMVKYLLDKRNYSQAKELALKILQRENLGIQLRIDLLIQLGNVSVRLGDLNDSVVTFKKAVNLSKAHQLNPWLSRALNALGWAYRNQGDYAEALSNYLEAYFLSHSLGDKQRTAWLLNNMGYINAFRGNRQKALDNCWTALEIWEELEFGRGIGSVHSTLGEVYRRFDQIEDAFFHYNKALDIFSEASDFEWMSLVRCGRGAAFLSIGDLERGMEDLEWALEKGPENIKPRILHYQAQFFAIKEEWDAAKDCLEESRKVSEKTGNRQYNFRSFTDLIDVAWESGEFDKWRKFKDDLGELCGRVSGEESYRLEGSSLRKIGDLAICNGDYKEGLAAYKEGLPLIAKYEVHTPYIITKQLKVTSNRILEKCSTAVVQDLQRDISEFIKGEKELPREYPGILLVLEHWRQAEGESA